MHDPEVVAFDVTLPIPRKYLTNPPGSTYPDWGVRRRRITNPARLGEPVYPWWRPTGYEVFAGGRRWRWWGPLLTIWHREPGGHDALTVCKGTRWQWHVRHWRIVCPPFRALQRRLFTRCAWCRGRSGGGRDTVNCAKGWDGSSRGRHWWSGETGLYHSECLGIEDAHKTCMCPEPDLRSYGAWGRCRLCGGSRYHDRSLVAEAVLRMYQALPPHTRPPAAFLEQVRALRGDRSGVAARG